MATTTTADRYDKSLLAVRKQGFTPAATFPPLEVEFDEEGWPIALVADEHIPVMSQDFELRIIQPGSVRANKELAPHINKIMIPGLDESASYEELLLLPITIISEGFRKFDSYTEGAGDNSLVCYSTDGLRPSEKVAAPLNHVCSWMEEGSDGNVYRKILCPYAQWDGDKKPECKSTITLAFLALMEDGARIPVRVQLHGTGMSAWGKLQREFKRIRNIAKLKRKSVTDYVIRLTLDNNGTYVAPVFTMIEAPTHMGKVSRYLPLIGKYIETLYTRTATEDSEESAASDTVDSDAATAPEQEAADLLKNGSEAVEDFEI